MMRLWERISINSILKEMHNGPTNDDNNNNNSVLITEHVRRHCLVEFVVLFRTKIWDSLEKQKQKVD